MYALQNLFLIAKKGGAFFVRNSQVDLNLDSARKGAKVEGAITRYIVNVCFTKRNKHNRVNYSFLSRLEIFDPDRNWRECTYVSRKSRWCDDVFYSAFYMSILNNSTAQRISAGRRNICSNTLCWLYRENDSLFIYIYIVLYGFPITNNDCIERPRHIELAISELVIR